MLAELTLIKRPEVTGDAGPAVLISVVQNEADILPAFFDHYRGLGIRSFVLIDNNSTDGTREVLLEQPDVILYAAAGSYREAFDGVSWLNVAGHHHALGQWCLAVDADEFLVLPAGDCKGLAGLIEHLEREISLGLFCPLVDFFPRSAARVSTRSDCASISDLIGSAPFVFCSSAAVVTEVERYPFVELRSRVRELLTKSPGYIPPLGKVPLFFWHEGFRLKRSTHTGSILPLSDQTGVLCHFKYRPGAVARATQEFCGADRQDMSGVQSVLRAGRGGRSPDGHAGAMELCGVADLRRTGWLGAEQGSFAFAWKRLNRSRQVWLSHLVRDGESTVAGVDCMESVVLVKNELMASASWRMSRRFRRFLVKRKIVGPKHLPEEFADPLGPAETLSFMVNSVWWDLLWPVRLLRRFLPAKRWRLLRRQKRGKLGL